MKRADLEHILRACKGTTGETEFIVMIRPSRLEALISQAADMLLRERLLDAWVICRRRAVETDPTAPADG